MDSRKIFWVASDKAAGIGSGRDALTTTEQPFSSTPRRGLDDSASTFSLPLAADPLVPLDEYPSLQVLFVTS